MRVHSSLVHCSKELQLLTVLTALEFATFANIAKQMTICIASRDVGACGSLLTSEICIAEID